eukprot:15916260-Heterocapsa_arctica.AAC.1
MDKYHYMVKDKVNRLQLDCRGIEHNESYNYCGTKTDQHGARNNKYKQRFKEQDGCDTYDGYGGEWDYYLYNNRSRLAQQ